MFRAGRCTFVRTGRQTVQFTNRTQQFEGLFIDASPLNSFKMTRAIFSKCHFEVQSNLCITALY